MRSLSILPAVWRKGVVDGGAERERGCVHCWMNVQSCWRVTPRHETHGQQGESRNVCGMAVRQELARVTTHGRGQPGREVAHITTHCHGQPGREVVRVSTNSRDQPERTCESAHTITNQQQKFDRNANHVAFTTTPCYYCPSWQAGVRVGGLCTHPQPRVGGRTHGGHLVEPQGCRAQRCLMVQR